MPILICVGKRERSRKMLKDAAVVEYQLGDVPFFIPYPLLSGRQVPQWKNS